MVDKYAFIVNVIEFKLMGINSVLINAILDICSIPNYSVYLTNYLCVYDLIRRFYGNLNGEPPIIASSYIGFCFYYLKLNSDYSDPSLK